MLSLNMLVKMGFSECGRSAAVLFSETLGKIALGIKRKKAAYFSA